VSQPTVAAINPATASSPGTARFSSSGLMS
jgi:hypothetical protein